MMAFLARFFSRTQPSYLHPRTQLIYDQGARLIVCPWPWCRQITAVWVKWDEVFPPSLPREFGGGTYDGAPLDEHAGRPFRLHERYGTDTPCQSCGRGPREWLNPWIEWREYADGCAMYYSEEGEGGHGPRHAPHTLFVEDEPIRVWNRSVSSRGVIESTDFRAAVALAR